MNKKIVDGGFAFPKSLDPYPSDGVGYPGMTLRDYFAGQAVGQCIAKCVPYECAGSDETMAQMFARKAYEVADAMIAARSKEPA